MIKMKRKDLIELTFLDKFTIFKKSQFNKNSVEDQQDVNINLEVDKFKKNITSVLCSQQKDITFR